MRCISHSLVAFFFWKHQQLFCLLSYPTALAQFSFNNAVSSHIISVFISSHQPLPPLHVRQQEISITQQDTSFFFNTSTLSISNITSHQPRTTHTHNPSRLFDPLAEHLLQHLPKHPLPPIASNMLIHQRKANLNPHALEKALVLDDGKTCATNFGTLATLMCDGGEVGLFVDIGTHLLALGFFLIFPLLHVWIVGAAFVFVDNYCRRGGLTTCVAKAVRGRCAG